MKKFIFITLASAGLLAAAFLLPIALEHRGFFMYQGDIFTSDKNALYQKELLSLVKQDPRKAFKRFREILSKEPIAHNTCHGIAHKMGHAAYETFGFKKAMQFQDGVCGGGYIHGIIESRFGLLQEKEILDALPNICTNGDGSCYHGIGHGLMIATKLNVDASLHYCDLLPSNGPKNCYEGAWMHVFDREETGLHDAEVLSPNSNDQSKQDFKNTNIEYCKVVEKKYKTSCYFYLPRIYAHIDEEPFTIFSSLCLNVEKDFQNICAVGVGHTLMKYHIANPNISFTRCAGFNSSDLVESCKEGGALYFFFDSLSGLNIKHSSVEQKEICNIFTHVSDQVICKKVSGYKEAL